MVPDVDQFSGMLLKKPFKCALQYSMQDQMRAPMGLWTLFRTDAHSGNLGWVSYTVA